MERRCYVNVFTELNVRVLPYPRLTFSVRLIFLNYFGFGRSNLVPRLHGFVVSFLWFLKFMQGKIRQ